MCVGLSLNKTDYDSLVWRMFFVLRLQVAPGNDFVAGIRVGVCSRKFSRILLQSEMTTEKSKRSSGPAFMVDGEAQ